MRVGAPTIVVDKNGANVHPWSCYLANLARRIQLARVGHYVRKPDKETRSRLLLACVGQLKPLATQGRPDIHSKQPYL